MTIKAGERMPAGKFKIMGEGKPQDLTTAQLFDGKRVVLLPETWKSGSLIYPYAEALK